MHVCPTPGLDPGHHPGPARPGVGNTPGFTADGAVPGCPLHGEARVRPHLPACAGYFTPYTTRGTTLHVPDGRTRTPETRSSLEARCARIRLIAQICATNSGILKFESEFTSLSVNGFPTSVGFFRFFFRRSFELLVSHRLRLQENKFSFVLQPAASINSLEQ